MRTQVVVLKLPVNAKTEYHTGMKVRFFMGGSYRPVDLVATNGQLRMVGEVTEQDPATQAHHARHAEEPKRFEYEITLRGPNAAIDPGEVYAGSVVCPAGPMTGEMYMFYVKEVS